MKLYYSILAFLVALVLFQNCQKADYTGTAQTSASKLAGSDSNPDVSSDMTVGPPSDEQQVGQAGVNAKNEDGIYEVCIIEDHGKSLKLGLVDGKLKGVNPIGQDAVCVTKAACEGPIAKAMKVIGSFQRGYCENNPNVAHLTDAEVANLLKK